MQARRAVAESEAVCSMAFHVETTSKTLEIVRLQSYHHFYVLKQRRGSLTDQK